MSGARPVAVVTGGARRVGRAIAVELARAGFDLVLTYLRSDDEVKATLELIVAADAEARARSHRVDFSDLEAAANLGEVLSRLPRVDAIVHNASAYESTPLTSLTAEQLLHHFSVNAAAPVLLTKALAPKLAASNLPGGGAIVCLGDMHTLGRPRKDFLAYSMSKAALSEMVYSLARELAPDVRVNGIAPGVVAWPEGTSPKEVEAYEARIPLARSGTPQDAAAAARFLILDAPYITGEIIRVDGGRWLR